jgi:hypothetical protein
VEKIYVTGKVSVERLSELCGEPYRLFAHWFGAFEQDGTFWGVIIPRENDWNCRQKLESVGMHVFPSPHSPHPLTQTHMDKVGAGGPEVLMRDVALMLHEKHGHPALHPDS